jgi:hypothetical protein
MGRRDTALVRFLRFNKQLGDIGGLDALGTLSPVQVMLRILRWKRFGVASLLQLDPDEWTRLLAKSVVDFVRVHGLDNQTVVH